MVKTNHSLLLLHQFVYLFLFFLSYEYLRKVISFPLPLYRTVCRHLQSIKFYFRFFYVILNWMAIKMFHYSATDRYCCLALDEVQISQGLQYDLSLKQFVGNVSAELMVRVMQRKNILFLPLMYHAIWRKVLQQNFICL